MCVVEFITLVLVVHFNFFHLLRILLPLHLVEIIAYLLLFVRLESFHHSFIHPQQFKIQIIIDLTYFLQWIPTLYRSRLQQTACRHYRPTFDKHFILDPAPFPYHWITPDETAIADPWTSYTAIGLHYCVISHNRDGRNAGRERGSVADDRVVLDVRVFADEHTV